MELAGSPHLALTAPMLVGMVISAKLNGRIVYETGRYKPLQLVGVTTGALSFAALAWAARTGQSLYVIEPALTTLGLGLGMVNPNMVVAVQNAADPRILGASTASCAFFRALGGVVGPRRRCSGQPCGPGRCSADGKRQDT